MARPRILEEAAAELAAAAELIEAERPGYGPLLLEEYARKLQQIARFPLSGAKVLGSESDPSLRSFSLGPFRYVVIVAAMDEPVAVAVAHTSREPGYWTGRLR